MESLALAPDASRLGFVAVQLHASEDVAFVAPRHPGASSAIIDRAVSGMRRQRHETRGAA